jgi:uncharacterized protein YdcH (DUF465 family)
MHEIGNKVEFTRLLEKYNELSAKIKFNQDDFVNSEVLLTMWLFLQRLVLSLLAVGKT